MSWTIIPAAIFGLTIGICLNWLVDIVPRWRVNQEDGRQIGPADWRSGLLALAQAGPHAADRYRLVAEIGMLTLTPIIFEFSGSVWEAGMTLLLVSLLTLVALVDLKYRLILNKLLVGVALTGLLLILTSGALTLLNMLGGAALAGTLFIAAAAVSPSGLGGGDIKLGAVIGLLFGYPALFLPLLVGVGSAGLFTIYRLATSRNLKAKIPYGPFLCGGTLIFVIFSGF